MAESRRLDHDWYELLEVSPRASQVVIQAAYRALVRDSHPDRNPTPEAEQRIRRLNEAYRILSDPEGRARYDLECARARRHQHLAHAGVSPTVVHAPPRPMRLEPATRRYQERPVAVSLHGQIILGLVMVAAVALVAMALVWAMDPADNVTVYRGTVYELTGSR